MEYLGGEISAEKVGKNELVLLWLTGHSSCVLLSLGLAS